MSEKQGEPLPHSSGGLFRRPVLHLFFIAVLGLCAYSNTLHVPFQWDDAEFVRDNPVVKDLGYFLEPSNAEGFKQYSAFKARYIGYLTFALNYKIHGPDVTGYHVFNLAVHIFNALLVYVFVILVFRTPFLKASALRGRSGYIALFSALLFVTHPVQTEAVTYIFQRLASLAAFFYLLSLVAYFGSRLSTGNIRRYALYALSLVSVVLAMKTKENAFTLPLVITLFEFLFFKGPVKLRLLRLSPLLLALFIIPLAFIGFDTSPGEMVNQLKPAAGSHGAVSREDYVLTQFRVIVTYIRLLLLPVNQNLDYNYPVFNSFLNPQVFLSFLFLIFIFSLAVNFTVSRNPDLRLISAGIFWFFVTLYVESVTIAIPMVINEYRVYLPSVGAFLAMTTGVFLLLERLKNKRIRTLAVSLLVLIPLVLSYAAYARNSVWKSEASLWEDVVGKSPYKARGHYNLGTAYTSMGLIDKAIEHCRRAVGLRPDYADAHVNLGIAYESKGLADKAIEHYKVALALEPANARTHNNLAIAYAAKGLLHKVIEHCRYALRAKPDFTEARYNLGLCYLEKGDTSKARRELEKVLQTEPDHHEARRFLDYISSSRLLSDHPLTYIKPQL